VVPNQISTNTWTLSQLSSVCPGPEWTNKDECIRKENHYTKQLGHFNLNSKKLLDATWPVLAKFYRQYNRLIAHHHAEGPWHGNGKIKALFGLLRNGWELDPFWVGWSHLLSKPAHGKMIVSVEVWWYPGRPSLNPTNLLCPEVWICPPPLEVGQKIVLRLISIRNKWVLTCLIRGRKGVHQPK
jgi:hypothetical protein